MMNTVMSSRPRNIKIAVTILCFVLIYSQIFEGVYLAHAHVTIAPAVSRGVAYALVVVTFCLNATFIYNIFKGRNWARVIYLAFFLFGMLFSLTHLVPSFSLSPTLAWFNLIGHVAQIVALALLFTTPGSTWFKPQADNPS